MNKKMYHALEVLASSFEKHQVSWVLVGTASLSLQNIDVEPADIDVLTTADDAYRAGLALKEYEETPISYGSTELFRSYRGVYIINSVKVEIMGDFEEKVGEGWISLSDRLTSPVMVRLGSIEVPVSSLQDQLVSYQRLGREKDEAKIKSIKEALQKRTERNP